MKRRDGAIRIIDNNEPKGSKERLNEELSEVLENRKFHKTNDDFFNEIVDLIDLGADVNTIDKKIGWTALMWAVEYGNYKTVEYLLEKKADVNYRNKSDMTAFHFSIEDDMEISSLLLKHGFNLKAKDDLGQNVLHFAAENGYLEGVEFLIDETGSELLNEKDNNGDTPLDIAILENECEVIDYIKKYQSSNKEIQESSVEINMIR